MVESGISLATYSVPSPPAMSPPPTGFARATAEHARRPGETPKVPAVLGNNQARHLTGSVVTLPVEHAGDLILELPSPKPWKIKISFVFYPMLDSHECNGLITPFEWPVVIRLPLVGIVRGKR